MNFNIITLILQIINKLLPQSTKPKTTTKQSYAKSVLSESRNFREASEAVRTLVDSTSIDRALVVVYHNGGEPIDEAKIRKVSILFEGHDASVISVMSQYQDFEVDDDYHKMIMKLRADKQMRFLIEDAPTNIVKYAYEQEGLKKVRLFEIAESVGKDIYVFASLSSKSPESLGWREKNAVLIAITHLKPIVQRILHI